MLFDFHHHQLYFIKSISKILNLSAENGISNEKLIGQDPGKNVLKSRGRDWDVSTGAVAGILKTI